MQHFFPKTGFPVFQYAYQCKMDEKKNDDLLHLR